MHKFWVVAVGCALSIGMGVAQEDVESLYPKAEWYKKIRTQRMV